VISYEPLFEALAGSVLEAWAEDLPGQIRNALNASNHGDLPDWLATLERFPNLAPSVVDFNIDSVRIGAENDVTESSRRELERLLRRLQPWRKGPYNLFGIRIVPEWRSDWKWQRLAGHIQPLRGRTILDVGCGNGYHCWRMLGSGASLVIGVDPTLLSVIQFHAIRRFTHNSPVFVVPLGIEDVPKKMRAFDTVFSMGVLYHRRSPLDHLIDLRDSLCHKGELVLETLVIDGPPGQSLLPENRYAQMRNVWFIPSCDTLAIWLKRCGFRNIRLIDVTKTTIEEQRSTEWMEFNSLVDFLDPEDRDFTIEGYPAPMRAIFIAEAP